MCDLGVSVRNRDRKAGITVTLETVAVAGGSGIAQILFSGFSMERIPWHLGVSWVRRMVLWLGLGRFNEELDVVSEPRTANGINEATIDSDVSAGASRHFLLHIHELDPPTLSPECPQPCHQSVVGHGDTARSHTPQGFS